MLFRYHFHDPPGSKGHAKILKLKEFSGEI
jgi:hypothetical protein